MPESSAVEPDSPVALVDPRAPRFGQVITFTLLAIGILGQDPRFVLAVALILGTAVITQWRLDLYQLLWRHVAQRFVGSPPAREPGVPHRFAKLLGATFTTIATLLLHGGVLVELSILVLAGYLIAAMVAVLAAVGGFGNYCIGCKMYEEVAFFRRLGVV